jgi:hypothetical protein
LILKKSLITYYILRVNFLGVVKNSNELLETDFHEFSQIIRADELNISEEKDLFETIIKWVDFNPSQRKKVKHLNFSNNSFQKTF